MASIQPSFLHFYLFRTRQHNTNFLLTSKDELKYPGGGWSFPSNPNLLLSFSIVNGVLYLFIHSANHISPFRTIHNRVHKFFGTYNEILKILYIYSLISHSVSNILFNKISNPIPGGPLQLSLFTNQSVLQWNLKPHSQGNSQNTHPILGRLHITFLISTTFPNSNPSHSLNYGSKGIWTFSRQNHWCPHIIPHLGLKS